MSGEEAHILLFVFTKNKFFIYFGCLTLIIAGFDIFQESGPHASREALFYFFYGLLSIGYIFLHPHMWHFARKNQAFIPGAAAIPLFGLILLFILAFWTQIAKNPQFCRSCTTTTTRT